MLKEKEEIIATLEAIVALEHRLGLEVLFQPRIDGEMHYLSQRVGFQGKRMIQNAKAALRDLRQE